MVLTVKQAIEYAGVSRKTLYVKMNNRSLPFFADEKTGKRTFTKEDLDKAFLRKKVSPVTLESTHSKALKVSPVLPVGLQISEQQLHALEQAISNAIHKAVSEATAPLIERLEVLESKAEKALTSLIEAIPVVPTEIPPVPMKRSSKGKQSDKTSFADLLGMLD